MKVHTVRFLSLFALATALAFLVAGCGGKDGSGTSTGGPSGPDSGKFAHADEVKPGTEKLPPEFAYVPRDALGFVRVNVGEFYQSELPQAILKGFGMEGEQLLKLAEEKLGTPLANIERVTLVVTHIGDGSSVVLAVTKDKYDQDKVLKALVPDAKEEVHPGKTLYVRDQGGGLAVHFASEKLVVAGEPAAVRKVLLELKPAPADAKGPLSPALAFAGGKHHVVAGFHIPAGLVEGAKENVPPIFSGIKSLLEVRSGTLLIDVGAEFRVTLQATFDTEAQAKAATEAAKAGLVFVRKEAGPQLAKAKASVAADAPDVAKLVEDVENALNGIALDQYGAKLQVSAGIKIDKDVFAKAMPEAVAKVRTAANSITSANNLNQIALAFHMYHHDFNRFPEHAFYSKDGKPLLSWRVAILPYLEEKSLYDQFKLDEPWDSEHNRKLLDRMPRVYQHPAAPPSRSETYYQVFVGKGTLFEPKVKVSFRQGGIPDGAFNTLLAVEAAQPVPWTKPDDLPYDPMKPLPKLGGIFPNGRYNVIFADRTVRRLDQTLPEQALRAVITRNGNETVDLSKFDK